MRSLYSCTCILQDRAQWRVIARNCNHSAFSGYRRTSSRYSAVECLKCGHVWRTKANYVDELQDRVGGAR